MQTDFIELRTNRNEWECFLGRLDAVGDEINRALNWSTRIEEPGSGVRIARTPKVKEMAGKITDNTTLEAKGKAEKIAGKVQVDQVKKVLKGRKLP